jgi:hypothetical protein
LFAFALRKSIAESDLEVAQRNLSAAAIKDRHHLTKREPEPVTTFARQQRHELGSRKDTRPFQPVSDSFPDRAHSRIVTPFAAAANFSNDLVRQNASCN